MMSLSGPVVFSGFGEVVLPLQGHLAMSEDKLDCHTVSWLLVGRGRDSSEHPALCRTAPTTELLVQTLSNPHAEELFIKFDSYIGLEPSIYFFGFNDPLRWLSFSTPEVGTVIDSLSLLLLKSLPKYSFLPLLILARVQPVGVWVGRG